MYFHLLSLLAELFVSSRAVWLQKFSYHDNIVYYHDYHVVSYMDVIHQNAIY